MPGVDPSTYGADAGAAGGFLAKSISTYPQVETEPRLRCYVRLSCEGRRK